MHGYDPGTGVIFFAEIQKNGVGCWRPTTPISAGNYGSVDSNAMDMIYPSDLSVSNIINNALVLIDRTSYKIINQFIVGTT